MFAKVSCLLVLVLAVVLPPSRLWPAVQKKVPVQPIQVVPIENFEVDADKSYRPAYIPREWGYLVSVQRIDALTYVLFLQTEDGTISLVRLTQRGGYLYVDTSEQGGIVTVIRREP